MRHFSSSVSSHDKSESNDSVSWLTSRYFLHRVFSWHIKPTGNNNSSVPEISKIKIYLIRYGGYYNLRGVAGEGGVSPPVRSSVPKWDDALYRGLWRATILSSGQLPLRPPCRPLVLKSLATPLYSLTRKRFWEDLRFFSVQWALFIAMILHVQCIEHRQESYVKTFTNAWNHFFIFLKLTTR